MWLSFLDFPMFFWGFYYWFSEFNVSVCRTSFSPLDFHNSSYEWWILVILVMIGRSLWVLRFGIFCGIFRSLWWNWLRFPFWAIFGSPRFQFSMSSSSACRFISVCQFYQDFDILNRFSMLIVLLDVSSGPSSVDWTFLICQTRAWVSTHARFGRLNDFGILNVLAICERCTSG